MGCLTGDFAAGEIAIASGVQLRQGRSMGWAMVCFAQRLQRRREAILDVSHHLGRSGRSQAIRFKLDASVWPSPILTFKGCLRTAGRRAWSGNTFRRGYLPLIRRASRRPCSGDTVCMDDFECHIIILRSLDISVV